MHGQDVVAPHLVADLPDRLQVGQRLDVTDGPADLGDDDVHRVGREPADAVLDLIGDVRDDLHGLSEIAAAPFAGDHLRVDLASGDVGAAVEVDVQEALVVADVEVGLGTVAGDEDLPVLERVHRAGIDVEVGIELLHGDPEATCLEETTEAGGGKPLTETGGHASGHKNVPGHVRLRHAETLPWVSPAGSIPGQSTGFHGNTPARGPLTRRSPTPAPARLRP